MTDAQLVYMTAGSSEEARALGKHLVQTRLAACVNIIDHMNSIYLWEGALQDDQEIVVIAKTIAAKVPALIHAVKERHSYESPCVVSLPVTDGNPDFLRWIAKSVA